MASSNKVFFGKLMLQAVIYTAVISTYGVHQWHKEAQAAASVDIPHATPTLAPSPSPLISQIQPTPAAPTATPIPQQVTAVPGQPRVLGNILMYHYIRGGIDPKVDSIGYNLSVPPDLLDQQLTALEQNGFQTITIDELQAGKGNSKSVALTFDDGYIDFYTNAYPILKKHNMKATAFIITQKIGNQYMNWDQIKELDQSGLIEIGSHTLDHRDLSTLSLAEQRDEIFTSKQQLLDQLGHPVDAFCYPSGKYDADTLKLVQEAGYTSATTTASGVATTDDNQFEYPRYRIEPTTTPEGLVKILSRS